VAAILGFGGTIIIMKVINAILGLRVKEVEEEVGLDITEQGETGYGDWSITYWRRCFASTDVLGVLKSKIKFETSTPIDDI
jgi:hypothetical protein